LHAYCAQDKRGNDSSARNMTYMRKSYCDGKLAECVN